MPGKKHPHDPGDASYFFLFLWSLWVGSIHRTPRTLQITTRRMGGELKLRTFRSGRHIAPLHGLPRFLSAAHCGNRAREVRRTLVKFAVSDFQARPSAEIIRVHRANVGKVADIVRVDRGMPERMPLRNPDGNAILRNSSYKIMMQTS